MCSLICIFICSIFPSAENKKESRSFELNKISNSSNMLVENSSECLVERVVDEDEAGLLQVEHHIGEELQQHEPELVTGIAAKREHEHKCEQEISEEIANKQENYHHGHVQVRVVVFGSLRRNRR